LEKEGADLKKRQKKNEQRETQIFMERKIEEANVRHEEDIVEERKFLHVENAKLEGSVKRSQNAVDKLKGSVDTLTDEVKELEQTKETLKTNVVSLEQKAEELKHIAKKLEGVLDQIGNEVEDLDDVQGKLFCTVQEFTANNLEQRTRQLRDIWEEFLDAETLYGDDPNKNADPNAIKALQKFVSTVYDTKMCQLENELKAATLDDGEVALTWEQFENVLARDNFWHSEPPVEGEALLPSSHPNSTEVVKEARAKHWFQIK